MMAGVAHTHTVLWYLLKDTRLSSPASEFMDEVAADGNGL
jgi:PIN domain nuclease of toxin-antitoxin system